VKTAQGLAERFSALTNLPGVVHGFTLRIPGIEMSPDRTEALTRLESVHREIRDAFGLSETPFQTAQQVHGKRVEVVEHTNEDRCFDNCDGLITDRAGVCLGIYVADCCAVYLVDRVRNVIGLVHSGKKGTELGVVSNTIQTMMNGFGSRASDITAQLSPCIRPPHYEINFANDVMRQCQELGVTDVYDCGICTGCDLNRYYSYRMEKGRTGRMLAFLSLGHK
jgi:copper oxidase (laccase) domain-containing protein